MLTVRLASLDSMSDAMKKAIRATRAWGGYVVAANYDVPGAEGDARLIVRIPVEHVQAAIQRFSDLGTLAAQDVSIRDVQAKLDGYTRNLLATREHIAKLRVKLAHAETDAQRASLDLQIAQAQRAAAELRAEQVTLKRQASFANVTLTLTTRKAAAAVPHKEGRIERTLGDAVSILALELVFVLYGLIVAAPIALLAALAFFGARIARRRSDDRLLGGT
jgi:multidrug efflux pump subunit AcrA (membrane-fusion protein)